MSSPAMLFLTFNDIDNRWKVVDNTQFPFGDGETKEEAIKSARLVSNATIFSDAEPDLIVDKVTGFDEINIEDITDDFCGTYSDYPEMVLAMAELSGLKPYRVIKDGRLKCFTFEVVE